MKECALFLFIICTSMQTVCSFPTQPMDYVSLSMGFLEGLFAKLSSLDAQVCVDSTEATATWVTQLVTNITQCKYSVDTACTLDTIIASITPLMSLLSKLVLNCANLPGGFTKIYTTFTSIFTNFDAYTKRITSNALTLLGLLVNYGTSGYLCLCSYRQYKKAGIEFGEALGCILTQ